MQSKELSANELHDAALDELGQRRFDKARAHIEKALKMDPGCAEFLMTAGRIHNNNGDLEQAERFFSRAVDLQPENADGWFNLGHVLHRSDKHKRAIDAFERSLQLNPVNHAAHQRLGAIFLEQCSYENAVAHLKKALSLQPGDAHAHYNLGLVLHELGRFGEAQDEFSAVIKLQPGDVDARSNLGAVLQSQGKFDHSIVEFRAALEIDPGHQPSLAALAGVHDLRGEYQEGIALLESAVVNANASGLPPGVALAVALAQLLSRVGRNDEVPALLHPLLEDHADDDPDLSPVLYTLGDYHDRSGEYDVAMQYFVTANAMHRVPFAPARHQAHISSIIDRFSVDRMAGLPRSGNTSRRPVFIVGMPRSGTSLVEQILASHDKVYGAGELNEIARLVPGYPDDLGNIDDNALADLARQYLDCLDDIDDSAIRVTDKMWHNFEYLGLIELLFPDACVFHCTRDPRDTALSCYFQSFGVAGPPFAYSLQHIADYYRQYRKLMAHWERVLKIRILEINYENLVMDTEQQVRRMLDFAGLEWDPACMEFDSNTRVVRTASHAQVREPIYTRSIGRYKKYANHIEPLLDLCDEKTL